MIILNYLMLVNKENELDNGYIPHDMCVVENRKKDKPNQLLLLEKVTYEYFKKMITAAKVEANFDIICDSAYRSIDYQKYLYQEQIKSGKDPAYLAVPGCSEHHTGLCVDVAAYQNNEYHDEPEFLEKEYEWLYNNSYRFGFILRYPYGKEDITGYPYEPWHYRFVGNPHAEIITKNKITLEEYLKEWL